MLKAKRFQPLQTFPLFALLALCGAVLLLPFAAYEIIFQSGLPSRLSTWGWITGIIVIASLLAFSLFQHGVNIVGSSLASVFLYLLPVYGVTLAIALLGERLEAFHLIGIPLVLSGVIIATWPKRLPVQPNS